MLKKSLTAIAVVTIIATVAGAVPPPSCYYHGRAPILTQCEVPVVMLIDKFAEVDCDGAVIELEEKGSYLGYDSYFEGKTSINIKNNFPVTILARIEAYEPDIASSHWGGGWDCMLEGDGLGFNFDAASSVHMDPSPIDGIDMNLWACCWNANLAVRPSNDAAQQVAVVYVTVTE